MKTSVLITLIFLFTITSLAQQHFLDSLQTQLRRANDDTTRVNILHSIGNYYNRQDSSIYYCTQAIELSEKINYLYGSFRGYSKLAFELNLSSNYAKALDMAVKSLKFAEQLKTDRKLSMAESYNMMGLVNRRMNFDSVAMDDCQKAMQLYKEAKAPKERMNYGTFLNIALIYLKWKKIDSALYYANMCYDVSLHYPVRNHDNISVSASTVANVYSEKGNLDSARKYYLIGLNISNKFINSKLLRVRFFNNYARFFQKINKADSCIYYASNALQLSRNNPFGEHASDAATILTEIYESEHQPDSALKYLKIATALKDSIFSMTKLQSFQLLSFEEGQRQKDIAIEKERYQNRVRLYALISAVGIFLFLVIILYRNNRQKQKAKNSIEKAYRELKTTQAQLVQSEKMASLGELTAGIAHEIQNPLNFVNNFSEVNKELLVDMKDEIDKGNLDEAKSIANDVIENQEKINHHGRRADAIVKGMLQHSRTSSGQKELTDINALCDEYLRLAYHGLRAKDKLFNAKFETDFDKSIEKINIAPQDIGRVVLNLINNAFYAVSEKARHNIPGYEPTVTVVTKKLADKVELRVIDNGNGIPQKVLDKIFQPFFTTKPTGEGTGLGLSLAYDTIKAHGGEIKVESMEGKGSEFSIQLPVKINE